MVVVSTLGGCILISVTTTKEKIMTFSENELYEALIRKHGFEVADRIYDLAYRKARGAVTTKYIARAEDYVLSQLPRF